MTHELLPELYVEQLRDLYNAEHQILTALPRMIDAVTHDSCGTYFRSTPDRRSST